MWTGSKSGCFSWLTSVVIANSNLLEAPRGERMIHRRKIISLLGCAAVSSVLGPPTVHAQQRIPRIGIIDSTPLWDSFRQALREFGYVEGRSVTYEYRESMGAAEGLAAAVGELAQLSVDRNVMRAISLVPRLSFCGVCCAPASHS